MVDVDRIDKLRLYFAAANSAACKVIPLACAAITSSTAAIPFALPCNRSIINRELE